MTFLHNIHTLFRPRMHLEGHAHKGLGHMAGQTSRGPSWSKMSKCPLLNLRCNNWQETASRTVAYYFSRLTPSGPVYLRWIWLGHTCGRHGEKKGRWKGKEREREFPSPFLLHECQRRAYSGRWKVPWFCRSVPSSSFPSGERLSPFLCIADECWNHTGQQAAPETQKQTFVHAPWESNWCKHNW